jgi:TonB family protein
MKKDSFHRKPESFVKQPNYPGGKVALDEFIKQHLQYPDEALRNKVEGTVSVEHDVDIFGNVIEARIKHGIGYGCNEEALRLVKLLKYEKRRYKGLHVVFHKTININFKIHEASKPPEPSQTVKYNLTQGNTHGGEIKITYTIRIDKQ